MNIFRLIAKIVLASAVCLFLSILVVLVASPKVLAADEPPLIQPDPVKVWLTSGEWSRHNHETICRQWNGCQARFRQNNTGIGLQMDYDRDTSAVLGYYHNSIYNETFYIGGTWTPLHEGRAKFGVVGAMASGYWYTPVPIGGLYGTYEYEPFGINLMWLPGVVAAVQLKFKIN